MSPAPFNRQPTLRVPLLRVGVVGLRCEAVLWFDLGAGRRSGPVRVRVDSGASLFLVPSWVFRWQGLPEPPDDGEVAYPTQTGAGRADVRYRPCRLQARWAEDTGTRPFDWPAYYVVDAPMTVEPVLGLGGVVTTCRWDIDGRPTPDFPHGSLTLEDTRGLARDS